MKILAKAEIIVELHYTLLIKLYLRYNFEILTRLSKNMKNL